MVYLQVCGYQVENMKNKTKQKKAIATLGVQPQITGTCFRTAYRCPDTGVSIRESKAHFIVQHSFSMVE